MIEAIEVTLIGLIVAVLLMGIMIISQWNKIDELEDRLQSDNAHNKNSQENLYSELHEDREKIDYVYKYGAPAAQALLKPPNKPVDGNYEYDPDDYKHELTTHQRVNLK